MHGIDLDAFKYLGRRAFWSHIWKELQRDNCWGMAAELSYYFLLGFFPFLIFLSNMVSLTGIEAGLMGRILNEFNRFLPEMTQEEVLEFVRLSSLSPGTVWAVLWMVVALWWSSLGLNGMVGVLNRAYRVREKRRFFRIQVLSIVVTIGVSLFIILAGVLLFFGDDMSRWALARLPLTPGSPLQSILSFTYGFGRWFLIFVFLNLGIQIVYFALPAKRHPWRTLSPGSLLASTGWILGSLAFSQLVNQNPAYGRLYGSLKSLIVLMIWFYLSSLFLVVGGFMDSEIFRLRRTNGLRSV